MTLLASLRDWLKAQQLDAVLLSSRQNKQPHLGIDVYKRQVHTIAGDFAEDIFIGNKVFRLTQNQGADGVKGFQFAHAVDFGEQETNCADNHRQYANMLENTDQDVYKRQRNHSTGATVCPMPGMK